MNSPRDPHAPHDRESLSALFDGELRDDAARFACKRLTQDAQWRQSCGNWQLAGDVLRGRSMAPAPPGFAARVRLELEREVRATATAPVAAAPVRRRWVGGAALAASVAVAGWFVANPFRETGPATDTPTPTFAATPAAVPAPAATQASPPAVAAVDASQDQARAGERTQRATGRSTRPGAGAPGQWAAMPSERPLPAGAPPTVLAASDDVDAALADPFRLPAAQDSQPRPWPRAVLPGYPANRVLTAGYGGRLQNADRAVGADQGPTFYPFEPRLAPEPDPSARSSQSGP